MGQINVIVAVDGSKLAQQVAGGSISAGYENAPTSLGSWGSSDVYVSMIAQHSVATNDQGQSELTIAANSGDEVIWSMTTFGNSADHTAFIYGGTFNPDDAISSLILSNVEVENYLPDNSGTLTAYTNHLYTATAIIEKVGVTIQYTLRFQLVDNSSGSVVGYFTWDPFIKVSG